MMGFCEKCTENEEYCVNEEIDIKLIKGKNIEYIRKEAYCKKCGSKIFVSEIRDENLKRIEDAFRKKEKLITLLEIKTILEKYDIGKRPLSTLLGWGDGTLTRYLNGDIPTKQYSDILARILKDPDFMEELLEQNKSKITEHAYNFCKASLTNIKKNMFISKDEEKIDGIVKYFLKKCIDITPLALQKLLYYAQGMNKAFNGEYLFENDCEAWVHGPVYKNIYSKYKNYGYNLIGEDLKKYEDIDLNEFEKEVLDSIVLNFGCYSGKILEKMTHNELPWRLTRKGLKDYESSDRIIEKKLISEYFNEIKKKYNMLNISDIKDYSVDLFDKIAI